MNKTRKILKVLGEKHFYHAQSILLALGYTWVHISGNNARYDGQRFIYMIENKNMSTKGIGTGCQRTKYITIQDLYEELYPQVRTLKRDGELMAKVDRDGVSLYCSYLEFQDVQDIVTAIEKLNS